MSDNLTNLIIKGLQGHKLDRRTFLKLGGHIRRGICAGIGATKNCERGGSTQSSWFCRPKCLR